MTCILYTSQYNYINTCKFHLINNTPDSKGVSKCCCCFLFCPISFQHLKHIKGSENNISTFPAFPLSEHSLRFSATCLSCYIPKHQNFKSYLSGLCYILPNSGGHLDPLNSTSASMLEYVLKGVKCHEAEAGIISRPCLPITPFILRQLHCKN